MADPDYIENLDAIDRISIILYRAGMVVTGLALFSLALQQFFYPAWFSHVLIMVALGAMLQASSLHIYNKVVRWFLVNATWFGCWMLSVSFVTAFISSGAWVTHVSLGAFIFTFSGLAYKESFCFSLTILKVIPILLSLSWFLIICSFNVWAAGGLMVSSLLYLYMAWRKMNMPLYYDLGDRRKYEV